MKYSLDTSAILDGWVRYYPPKVFPTVWRRLEYLIMGDRLIVTEEVVRELEKQEDELYRWIKDHPRMVIPINDQIQVEAKRILDTYPNLVKTQKNRHQADLWVIALACVVENGVVVSGEARRNLRNPKVPDVCDDMGILHMRLVDVFIREGFSI